MKSSFKKYLINKYTISFLIIASLITLVWAIVFLKTLNNDSPDCLGKEKIEWENKTETEIEIIFLDDCYYKVFESLIKEKGLPTEGAGMIAYKGKFRKMMKGYLKEKARREKFKEVKK